MSFKKELEKILLVMQHYTGSNQLSKDRLRKEALTSIINLVDKELPKFIDVGKYDLDCPPTDLHRAAGYNQAIDDMRNKLRGE